jgi:hypothetical protein
VVDEYEFAYTHPSKLETGRRTETTQTYDGDLSAAQCVELRYSRS